MPLDPFLHATLLRNPSGVVMSSTAAQRKLHAKSTRTSSSSSSSNCKVGVAHSCRQRALPKSRIEDEEAPPAATALPACPAPPSAEACGDAGDPYQMHRGALFQCINKGYRRWYDRKTFCFFDNPESLYLAHSPKRLKRLRQDRRRAIVAAAEEDKHAAATEAAVDPTIASTTATVTNAAVPATERLATATALFKANRDWSRRSAHYRSNNLTPPADDVAVTAAVTLALDLCTSSTTHAWAFAKSGGVGALAQVAKYWLLERRSRAQWLCGAIGVVAVVANTVFESVRRGKSKRGLRRAMKPEFVSTACAGAVISTMAKTTGGTPLCAGLLHASIKLLHVCCVDMVCENNGGDDATSTEQSRRAFVAAGGLSALLVAVHAGGWAERTAAGTMARVLLPRFTSDELRRSATVEEMRAALDALAPDRGAGAAMVSSARGELARRECGSGRSRSRSSQSRPQESRSRSRSRSRKMI
jgi:hypothetical protein